jgi:kinesin family protein 15
VGVASPRSHLSYAQQGEGDASRITSISDEKAVFVDGRRFQFDAVAGAEASQDTIFEMVGRPIVDSCVAGFNGCIFAYGQTGSGKTYTMQGTDESMQKFVSEQRISPSSGLLQRIVVYLFECIDCEREASGAVSQVRFSYCEIYNDEIRDLLDTSNEGLRVRSALGYV